MDAFWMGFEFHSFDLEAMNEQKQQKLFRI